MHSGCFYNPPPVYAPPGQRHRDGALGGRRSAAGQLPSSRQHDAQRAPSACPVALAAPAGRCFMFVYVKIAA